MRGGVPAPRGHIAVLLCLAGCAHLAEGTPPSLGPSEGWSVVPRVRFHAQKDARGCGPAALAMVLEAWGRSPAAALDRPDARGADAPGATAGELRDLARRQGLAAFVVVGRRADLIYELDLGHPVVLGIASREGLRRYSHFVVLVGRDASGARWLLADPDRGWRSLDDALLMSQWQAAGFTTLVVYPQTE